MPGRQSHGRSLLGKSQSKAPKRANQKSKAKARAHALDAFAIAGKQVQPDRMTRRGRDLELEPERQARGGKHRRDEDSEDDEEDDEDEGEGPRKKRPRQAAADDGGDDESDEEEVDGGSDSEGHEWHVGVNSEDDDSEIESDEAFGESDDEKFDGYTFRAGREQKKRNGDDSSDEEDAGDDGESLGSDAIDLADALVQSSDDDDEGSQGATESGSDEEDSESESSATDDDDEDDENDNDVEADPAKLMDLQKIFKSYADKDNMDTEADSGALSKQAISLEGLGLSNVKDPSTKKGLKLLKKEEKAEAGKKGKSKKLDVPLARRQQDQLDRIAAYEKTNETLNRWNDTVKQNRRADHLMFPLPDTLADAGLDNGELLPLTKKTAGTELEQTIMSIMEESGLGPSAQSQKQKDKKIDATGEEQTISRSELKELWAQRRKDRELQSREQKRAKRIKKIKSKTYRRVHRKERLGEEAKEHAEMKANGEIDSEDEREAAARRRALERVGAKHKDSRWAKMGSKVGRAAWDDDYRAGLTDMARRDEMLRKRVEGRVGAGEGDEDSDGTSSSGEEDGNSRLLKELDGEDDEDEDAGPYANLMKLKFMQRAEAARKQENDGLVAEIRRELESGSEQDHDSDAEAQVGRRSYGLAEQKKRLLRDVKLSVANGAKNNPLKGGLSNTDIRAPSGTDINDAPTVSEGPGAWSSGKSAVAERKRKKIKGDGPGEELDLDATALPTGEPSKPSKTKTASKAASTRLPSTSQAEDDSSDDEFHHPLAVRDQELADRAFAGDEVVAEFEAEKEAIMSEDDEKMVDNTMPGWGSWAGEGISKRALRRNKGKVMTKKEGIKKKDRKDAKLKRVIINEKRNRKNEKFLASQLPHPFESRQQYERSLRLPVGPEWMTKESFQASTKPRVIVKQGIIAPMAKPTV